MRSISFSSRNLRFSMSFRCILATIVEVLGITSHLTWKSSMTSFSQEEGTLVNKTALCGWSNIAAHISHGCPPLFSTTVLLPAFFGACKFSAASSNRNICVLTSKVFKLQSMPFCVPYKMISHWLLHELYSSCWLAYWLLIGLVTTAPEIIHPPSNTEKGFFLGGRGCQTERAKF